MTSVLTSWIIDSANPALTASGFMIATVTSLLTSTKHHRNNDQYMVTAYRLSLSSSEILFDFCNHRRFWKINALKFPNKFQIKYLQQCLYFNGVADYRTATL